MSWVHWVRWWNVVCLAKFITWSETNFNKFQITSINVAAHSSDMVSDGPSSNWIQLNLDKDTSIFIKGDAFDNVDC